MLAGILNRVSKSKDRSDPNALLSTGAVATDSGSSTDPPFTALLIGINEYTHHEIYNLEGAVADVLAFKQYLEEDLGVQPSRIRLLLDADATRSAIIQEFTNLTTDRRINHGDPIFIFYAGHGGEVDKPKGWKAGDPKVQMLIPHDYRPDINGRGVYGIPDRTIGSLLSRVAEKCGDNITVILDCCYSGSGTRHVTSQSSRKARFTTMPKDVPSDLDRDIWSGPKGKPKPGVAIAPGFQYHGLRSHMLLSACGAKELAYEYQGMGVFTAALLKVLVGAVTREITYTTLLQLLPSLPQQNPQCEGFHRNRFLFNSRAQSRRRISFRVRIDGNGYLMDAGTAHGVEVGDEYIVYADPRPSQESSPLGILVVRQVCSFSSTVAPPGTPPYPSQFHFHEAAFAFLTKPGNEHDLRVCTTDQINGHAWVDRPRFMQVEKEQARLTIDIDRSNIVLDILDKSIVTLLNSQRIPCSVKFDTSGPGLNCHAILDAAVNFHWNFCHTNKHHCLQKKVRLEFTDVKQVEGEYDDDLNPILKIGDNLIQNGIINLVFSPKKCYGVKILNDSPIALYAALFYFDINDLSITLLSPLPGAGLPEHEVDPSILPGECITFGYGSGGGQPFVLTLHPGHDVEVGFLKLFVGTEYMDLSHVEQPSPFKGARGIGRASVSTKISTWDTIVVPIVHRKLEG